MFLGIKQSYILLLCHIKVVKKMIYMYNLDKEE